MHVLLSEVSWTVPSDALLPFLWNILKINYISRFSQSITKPGPISHPYSLVPNCASCGCHSWLQPGRVPCPSEIASFPEKCGFLKKEMHVILKTKEYGPCRSIWRKQRRGRPVSFAINVFETGLHVYPVRLHLNWSQRSYIIFLC